jgi:RNA polymerase sigma factor (sigma-70 family)
MDIEMVVGRAAAGDERAWAELVARYGRLLRSVAARLQMRHCDVDDAAQLTWMALRNGIHDLRNPEHVGTWLCQVMRRHCVRILVHQRTERLEDETDGWSVPDDTPAAIDRISLEETAEVLWRVVDRLPERERTLLRALFDGQERSYRDIAHNLSMPIGSIGPIRMRALERLPAMLAEAGVTAEDLHAWC